MTDAIRPACHRRPDGVVVHPTEFIEIDRTKADGTTRTETFRACPCGAVIATPNGNPTDPRHTRAYTDRLEAVLERQEEPTDG